MFLSATIYKPNIGNRFRGQVLNEWDNAKNNYLLFIGVEPLIENLSLD